MTKTTPKLVFLTAFNGTPEAFQPAYKSLMPQLSDNDFWIIVLDGRPKVGFDALETNNIRFISTENCIGAGAARNLGLDYLFANIIASYFLITFDGDDCYKDGAIDLMRSALKATNYKIVVFGQERIRSGRASSNFQRRGPFSYLSQLFQYNMPVGVSCVRIDAQLELKQFRFGLRKRANDHQFFLGVIKFSKYGYFISDVVHEYFISTQSLSGKKWKMIFYKVLALRDHGLTYLFIAVLLPSYAFRGIFRHILNRNI